MKRNAQNAAIGPNLPDYVTIIMWASRQLTVNDQVSFLRDARDYALTHGLVMRNPNAIKDNHLINNVSHLAFTTFPSPFPQHLYQECLELQPIVNNLLYRVASDSNFMESNLEQIEKVDSFTRNLLEINRIILKEGQAQPVMSCISRADYMLDGHSADSLRMRQVEVNAIASSMSAHSTNVSSLHEFLMSKYAVKLPENFKYNIPKNESLDLIAQGIIDAFDAYGKSSAYVLLVQEETSLNFSDQYLVGMAVHKKRPDVRVIRRAFKDLQDDSNGNNLSGARLGPNKELLIDDDKEIGLVYFRYGYDPSNYDFSGSWNLRLMLERSKAIKCPSINFHLAGAKKFQQVLNTVENLEQFLSTDQAERLAKNFCQFWSLNSDTPFRSSEAYQMIKQRPNDLVLKPQREGGGHNVFGIDIETLIDKIDSNELAQYILMEYINSPREHNWILFPEDWCDTTRLNKGDPLVSELGIYGSILACGKSVLSNNSAGYLVRSKRCGVNEGGVTAGYAGISSIILLDNDCLKGDYGSFYECQKLNTDK